MNRRIYRPFCGNRVFPIIYGEGVVSPLSMGGCGGVAPSLSYRTIIGPRSLGRDQRDGRFWSVAWLDPFHLVDLVRQDPEAASWPG